MNGLCTGQSEGLYESATWSDCDALCVFIAAEQRLVRSLAVSKRPYDCMV